MKKYFKYVLLAFCVAVLSASMLLATACGSKSVSAETYVAAEKAWDEAQNKTAKDDIVLTLALPTGLSADLKLTAKGNLTRTYKSDKITKIEGAVTYLSIEGLDKIWNAAGSIVGMIGLSDDIKDTIVDLIGSGTITLDGAENRSGTIVEGTISKQGDVYALEGSVYVNRWFGDLAGTNLDIETEEAAEVETEKVDSIIELFIDKDKYFDSISLYQLGASDFTVKDDTTLTASFDGKKAMKWLLDILFEKLDAIIEGEEDDTLEDKLDEYGVSQADIEKVMEIFGKVKTYIHDFFDVLGAEDAKSAIETFVSFKGNTEATATFNGEQIGTFGFNQKVDATLTKTQFNKLVNFALDVVEDFGVELPSIVGSVKGAIPGLVFKGDYKNQITANIDLTVTTTLTIK